MKGFEFLACGRGLIAYSVINAIKPASSDALT